MQRQLHGSVLKVRQSIRAEGMEEESSSGYSDQEAEKRCLLNTSKIQSPEDAPHHLPHLATRYLPVLLTQSIRLSRLIH